MYTLKRVEYENLSCLAAGRQTDAALVLPVLAGSFNTQVRQGMSTAVICLETKGSDVAGPQTLSQRYNCSRLGTRQRLNEIDIRWTECPRQSRRPIIFLWR